MQGTRIIKSIYIGGTLAANYDGNFSFPFPVTLEAVVAVASNDSDATLDVGDSGDPNGIIAAEAIGDSGAPVTFLPANWDGADADGENRMSFAANTIFDWVLDFDGSSGTAAQDVNIDFIFTEG